MLVKKWRLALVSLIVPVLICPLFLFVQAGRAYGAPDVLDLQLGDPAIIRWDISDVAPGDSGIEPVNLHNAGDIPGYVYIWIGDIADGEGINPESETGNTAEPGELSSSIILDIINPGMSFGELKGNGYMRPCDLPVTIASFPGSSNRALFILDTAVNPGETLELQWQWQLPASVGNEVQGDNVSFTFYYMLSSYYAEEEEPGGPPPSSPPTTPATTPPTTPATTPPTVEPALPARMFVSEDGRCEIYIPGGLHVYIDSGGELVDITINPPADAPPPPERYKYGSKVYRMLCFTDGDGSEATGLRQDVHLTIYLDAEGIPEDAEVFLVSYHPVYGWMELDASGGIAEGKLTARVDYLNLVAVVYEDDGGNAVLITTEPPATPDTEPSDLKAIWARASLGVAVTGTAAMTIMAVIERMRRGRRNKARG